MSYYCLRLIFLLAFVRCIFSLSIIEHTLDQNRSYKDCFIDPTVNEGTRDYLSYCLRIDNLLNESWPHTCHTGDKLTFKQLRTGNISTDDLLKWRVPLDIADLYGAFLSDSLSDDSIQFICNCSLVNVFGRYCEYSFDEEISTIEDLINSSIEEKKIFYPKERLLPCYELENNSERCLDYRDICDGEFDTMNGEDELHCDLIETNSCDNNQFRCRNGFCIDRQFLFDGQGDCTDFSDEQRSVILKRLDNFENCYQKSRFDCDEHWCGREMISCGDGECIPWFQRFWGENDCRNSYTHVYNCELEERNNKSIDFSITGNNGRCTTNIAEFNITDDDQCLLMIKCAVTLHPSCKLLGIHFEEYKEAIAHAYVLCQNRTKINYASGARFFSPFVQAYYIPTQFIVTVELEFFALMNVRVPGLLCLTGKHMCRGIMVVENGSRCFNYNEIFERKDRYPFPPYEYLFCELENRSIDYCMNTSFFYRCRTTGECISKYRLFDGFFDCLDKSDEEDFEVLNSLEPLFIKDRYNCTMNGRNFTAVMRHFLGDGINHCKDGSDEMSSSINWQKQQCFSSDDVACTFLQDLYYNRNKEEKSIQIVRFTSLCDSIWDLRNGSDETDCHEWICEPGWIKQESNLSHWSGNCINPSWKCDQIWDYNDGSDEYNCNYTELYPIPNCLSLEKQEIILLNESNKVAGNSQIDCLGGIDERVTFACKDGFPLNERFLCNDKVKCLEPMYLCNYVKDCSDGEDESEHWCGLRPSFNSSICQPNRFSCQERNDSGPCIPQEDRCHDERESCKISHQDEYMCIHPRKHNRITFDKIPSPEMQQAQSIIVPPWYCDRGLVVRRYDKLACLCPSSFYGYRCEKHSHRLTVIFTLNMSLIKADLIRINVLLINHNEMIDHILLTQEPSYTGKHRIHLNYPRYLYSHLRKESNNSSVQFRLYAIDNNTVRLAFISQYHIKYSFLPAFRLVVTLSDKEYLIKNHQLYTEYSDKQNSRICPCARGSQCSFFGNQHVTCICASQQYGPTCHLTTTPCLNVCQNQGHCISYKDQFYNQKFRCVCSTDHFGDHCQLKKPILSYSHNEAITPSVVRLIQLINYDRTNMGLNIEEKHLMLKNSEQIFHNDFQLPSIGLLKVYRLNHLDIYLLYIGQNYSNINLTEQNKTLCRHVKEFGLQPTDHSHDGLLFIMKRYHRPCQQSKENMTTVCFYDLNTYFCFCNETTHRASCFLYDFKSDHCNLCLNGGQCIQGDFKKEPYIHCLCPRCYYGRRCEFGTEAFGFTLDSLIVHDSLAIQVIYLCLTTSFFLVGLFTNTCSFVTFKRATPRKFGVGNYLFVAAILNQISLLFLVMKMLSILLGTRQIAHIFFCKGIAYFLSVTTRTNYWLTTWITIERLVIIPFPTFTTLRNPKVAIVIIIITFLVVFGMHFHELMSYTVIEYSSICIPIFRSSVISVYNQATLIFHHLIPFLVQVFMITLLIFLATRSRVRSVGRKTTFKQALKKQFHTHKELYLTPAIIVLILSILPQGILSISIVCTELKHWQRYMLLITYFLSYLPQMLGFILQVLPSSGYTTEFKETSIGKLTFFKWVLASKPQQAIRKDIINLAIISAELNRIEEEQQSEQPRENTINVMSTSL